MSVFDFRDYKQFVNGHIERMPMRGRGQLKRISEFLGIHATMCSHIFRGDSHLSLEQASDLCRFFDFSEKEKRYFLLLVQFGRAGSAQLCEDLETMVSEAQEESRKVGHRVGQKKILSPDVRARFYSHWRYSAIRIACTLENSPAVTDIAQLLRLSKKEVEEVLSFLVVNDLVVEDEGRYRASDVSTHVEESSPFVTSHHGNWRRKAMDRHGNLDTDELSFTAPLSISAADAQKIKTELLNLIESIGKTVTPSKAEEVFCFNLDWFRVGR